MHGGVRVVENVHGSRPGLPCECLDHALAGDGDWWGPARYPPNCVLQQSRQVGMAAAPHGALDVAREVDQADLAGLTYYHCRFIRMVLERIRQFRRIGHEARDNRQNRAIHGSDRDAIFRSGNPVGAGKSVENLVLLRAGQTCVYRPTASPAFRMPNTSASPKSGRRSLRSLNRPVS